jgi:hypothetical protein
MTDLAKDTIRSMLYAHIMQSMVEQFKLSVEEAMDIFYNSETFVLIDKGVADLHCRSYKYLAGEVWREYQETHGG